MPASPNDPRTKRRKAMGDDPNKTLMAPQPIPGMPQDGKGGNAMNNPMIDVNGQMSQKMGSGGGQFMYGDGMLDKKGQASLGNVGFVGVSGQPEHMVPGRRLNSNVLNVKQPDQKQMEQMEPQYEMAAAQGFTMKNGLNNGQPVSYNVSPMGPVGGTDPAMLPPQMGYEGPNSLPMAGGMSTGRGGGRNKGKK